MKTLLSFDSGAALIVGLATLALDSWWSQLSGFPEALVRFMGVANLLYGLYSGTLALRLARGTPPSRGAIDLLVAANLTWSGVCAGLVVATHARATALGTAQLVLEGGFVAALALAEHRGARRA